MHLQWIGDRWHLDGRGIHAGDILEMSGNDCQWFPVRIESRNNGKILDAYAAVHGMSFARKVDTDYDSFRWPE